MPPPSTHRIPKDSRWKQLVIRVVGQPDLLTRLHLPDVIAALDLQPDEVALDVGCGNGLMTYLMASRARKAYGVDIADVSHLPIPPELAGRLEFVTARGEDTPLDDASVDVVLLAEVVATIGEPRLFLDEVSRVLAPGGRVVVVNGGDKRAIRRAYERNSLLVRLMRRLGRAPADYETYLAELMASFGNALPRLPDERDLRALLTASGFAVHRVTHTPSAAAQGIYERIQFALHSLGRRTYGPHHFVLYPLLRIVDAWSRGERGTGMIVVARRRGEPGQAGDPPG